jgi:hypothetical protein
MMAKKAEEVSGLASRSEGKEGCYVCGEVDPKSREKDDARTEGKEGIFPALVKSRVDRCRRAVLGARVQLPF